MAKRSKGPRGGGLGKKNVGIPNSAGGNNPDGRSTEVKQAKFEAEVEARVAETLAAQADVVLDAVEVDEQPMTDASGVEDGEVHAIPITQAVKDEIVFSSEVGLTPGQVIMPSDPVPPGWQRIFFENGVVQAWPLPKEGYNPLLCMETQKLVDEAYRRSWATPDDPDRHPVQLRVNRAFKQIMPTTENWGDGVCPITVVDDGEFPEQVRIKMNDSPLFRFVLSTEAAELIGA
jgi:hypothetical protein